MTEPDSAQSKPKPKANQTSFSRCTSSRCCTLHVPTQMQFMTGLQLLKEYRTKGEWGRLREENERGKSDAVDLTGSHA